MALDPSNRAPQHGADKQSRGEHSAGRTAHERERGRKDFQAGESGEHSPCELVVHGLVHKFVASTHHLRKS